MNNLCQLGYVAKTFCLTKCVYPNFRKSLIQHDMFNQLRVDCGKVFFINFLFSFSIKNTTNNKLQEHLTYKKKKHKSEPQPETEPLPNLHLAVPRQHINLKITYF